MAWHYSVPNSAAIDLLCFGAIRYIDAIPLLKRVILESNDDEALQQTAYEALLSILGKDDYDVLEMGVDKPTVIDWELVRSL